MPSPAPARALAGLAAAITVAGAAALALPAVAADQSAGPQRQQETKKDAGEFPTEWYFTRAGERMGPVHLEGKPAPKLEVRDWLGDEQDLSKLAAENKIVVVDYWATWCGPCVAAIPKNIEMTRKYEDDVVIIGVHDARRGSERMAQMAAAKEINYPLCIDVLDAESKRGASTTAWGIKFWPTYFVLDHEGIVRAAGLKPGSVSKVVDLLVAEKKAAEKKNAG